MSPVDGHRVTDPENSPDERQRCARNLFRALLGAPLLNCEEQAIFHGDPHAGNVFAREGDRFDGPFIIPLDWSQAGRLDRWQRYQILNIALGLVMEDADLLKRILLDLANEDDPHGAVAHKVEKRIADTLANRLPNDPAGGLIDRTFRLVDRLALDGVHFPADLLLFRKAFFTLEGVLHDVDPDFHMDSAFVELIGETLVTEIPSRWVNMMFPILEERFQYRSLLSNLDLVHLWSQLFSKMLRRGLWENRAAHLLQLMGLD